MRGLRSLGFLVAAPLLLSLGVGCATYRQDLERGRHHYDLNQYEAALALFRVLEPDLDSLSPAEQAQYSYLRGMTDYRLSSIAPQGSTVSDPKKGYRDNARHWLAFAASVDKQTPGGLTEDEKGRLNEAMTDLNHDWYASDADKGATVAKDKDKDNKPLENKVPQ